MSPTGILPMGNYQQSLPWRFLNQQPVTGFQTVHFEYTGKQESPQIGLGGPKSAVVNPLLSIRVIGRSYYGKFQ
jgi:hypothetical protein